MNKFNKNKKTKFIYKKINSRVSPNFHSRSATTWTNWRQWSLPLRAKGRPRAECGRNLICQILQTKEADPNLVKTKPSRRQLWWRRVMWRPGQNSKLKELKELGVDWESRWWITVKIQMLIVRYVSKTFPSIKLIKKRHPYQQNW